jgi:hypothetical protein
MNTQVLIERIKSIEYQFLNNTTAVLTEQQKVDSVIAILNSAIINQPDGVIVDADMPASILGVSVNWSVGNANDKFISVNGGTITQNVDLKDVFVSSSQTNLVEDAFLGIYTQALGLAQQITTNPQVTSYNFTDYENVVLDADIIANLIIA